MSKKYLFTLLTLPLAGLTDSIYLTREHYLNQAPICGIYANSCGTVTQSQYAQIGGIPLALLGIGFYLSVLLLTLLLYFYHKRLFAYLLTGLATIGVCTSIFLTYLQAYVIKSWCYWCLFSALITLLIFFTILGILKTYQKGMTKIN